MEEQIRRIKRRNSIILIAVILAAAAVMFISYTIYIQSMDSQMLEIIAGNQVYGHYRLSEDQTIKIYDTNICEIKDGKVTMTWADCPDQICVHSIAIDKNGGTIVCLPNLVVLNIVESTPDMDNPDAVDSITG